MLCKDLIMNKTIILIFLLGLIGCKGKVVQETQTILVKRGSFSEELTEQGTVRAVNSVTIASPNISCNNGLLSRNGGTFMLMSSVFLLLTRSPCMVSSLPVEGACFCSVPRTMY